jgi:hypothetical protein
MLGAGGMGEVWKARDTRVNRVVALKFAQAGFTERFERERTVIASLNHPNICQLYDVGPDYFVMEYVDGTPLRPPGDWRRLLDIAVAIAGGLADAHAAGIIHRDLKPDNVLMREDGVVKILDFGLAKRAFENTFDTRTLSVTAAGNIVGTVAYMSPEQATGRDLDARSDQFAFGLILYELASGKRPFARPSSAETMAAIIRDDPEPLPADLPQPLVWIIERCLAKDPTERYDSTRDLYRELRSVRQRASGIMRTPASVVTRPSSGRRLWMRDALLLVAGIVLGAVATTPWWGARGRDAGWSGVRLGGASVSLNPRMSPDGHLLAFIALVNGVTEVGVMEPGSASWTLLTHGGHEGYAQNLSWSHDGSRLYFDRYWGQPAGVYTIPPLGGDPVLVLEKAFAPKALPDGSLLVVRLTGSSNQIFRLWPENGKLQALPAFLGLNDVAVPYCPFADGRQVAYFGKSAADVAQPAALRILNLDTGSGRALDPGIDVTVQGTLSLPLTVTPDGTRVITLARRGDTYDVIEVKTDGTPGHRVLMTLVSADLPWFIEAASDGSLYMDQAGRPASILRMSVNRNAIEQFSVSHLASQILPLPDGRIAAETSVGKRQIVIGPPGSELRPLLQLAEPSRGPHGVGGARCDWACRRPERTSPDRDRVTCGRSRAPGSTAGGGRRDRHGRLVRSRPHLLCAERQRVRADGIGPGAPARAGRYDRVGSGGPHPLRQAVRLRSDPPDPHRPHVRAGNTDRRPGRVAVDAGRPFRGGGRFEPAHAARYELAAHVVLSTGPARPAHRKPHQDPDVVHGRLPGARVGRRRLGRLRGGRPDGIAVAILAGPSIARRVRPTCRSPNGRVLREVQRLRPW